MTAALLVGLLAGCAPQPRLVTGLVVDRDTPQTATPVQAGGRTAITNSDGQFAIEARPGEFPTTTAVPSGGRAHSDLSCADAALLDVTLPLERPTATLAFVMRNVQFEPEFHVHYQTLEGTERDPITRRWDLEEPEFQPDPRDPTLWTATLEVPIARRWAVAVSALVPRPWRSETHYVVNQVLVTTGDALGVGEVRYVDALLSDETLRDRVYWDVSGPGGVEEARFFQQVAVDEFVMDLTTWRGPVSAPIPVPVVLLREADVLLGFRGWFRYAGTDACLSREVGMDATLEPGEIQTQWLDGATFDTDLVEVTLLRFPDPLPQPPELVIDDGDRPELSWLQVPREDAALHMDLRGTDLRWTAVGQVGCLDPVVAWPLALDPREDRRLVGTFGWTSDTAYGTCFVDTRR